MTEKTKMTAEEIQEALPHFYGSVEFHKFSMLFSRHLLTDGAKFIAEECGAYWLMDILGSYTRKVGRQDFQVWTLKRLGKNCKNDAVVTCEDGNGNQLIRQFIPYTDFPLDEITLWCTKSYNENGQPFFTVMLPSEY